MWKEAVVAKFEGMEKKNTKILSQRNRGEIELGTFRIRSNNTHWTAMFA
jgi:hypothetical protein